MPNKDFENYELRLQTLREEQAESFEVAEKIFQEKFAPTLEQIFPRDILGVKREIAANFIISSVDSLPTLSTQLPHHNSSPLGEKMKSQSVAPFSSKGERIQDGGSYVERKNVDRNKSGVRMQEIFQKSITKALLKLPLNPEKREQLIRNILRISEYPEERENIFSENTELKRDPFFALVEEFAIDGEISKAEFMILSESYSQKGEFMSAIGILPENLRELFNEHIGNISYISFERRNTECENEYSNELEVLKNKGVNTERVMNFIARSYFRPVGKLKERETPAKRLRRTMKMSLLRLLKLKLGNVDTEKILAKFESGESFEDFFMLLYKLMEVVDENPNSKEVFQILEQIEETEELVITAEQTKEKILQGEKLTAKISSIFGNLETGEEQDLLNRALEDGSVFHGDEITFAENTELMAGVYSDSDRENRENNEDEKEELEGNTLEGKIEILKDGFIKLDEKKRKAFGLGDYEAVDAINDELISLQKKLEKLSSISGELV